MDSAVSIRENLGFGCVGLTALGSVRAADRLLSAAWEQGLRYFDTAPLYGRGYSERLLGDFLRSRRDDAIIATKFGLPSASHGFLPTPLALRLNQARRLLHARRKVRAAPLKDSSASDIRQLWRRQISLAEVQQSFDQSRRSLRTDFIDIFLLHEGIPAFLAPKALEFLLDLRARGDVGRIGLAAPAAACGHLDPEDLKDWDVLQYEAPQNPPLSANLREIFPAKLHIFHSCLKPLIPLPSDEAERLAPAILRRRVSQNPTGRILFSTSRATRIGKNISQFTYSGGG